MSASADLSVSLCSLSLDDGESTDFSFSSDCCDSVEENVESGSDYTVRSDLFDDRDADFDLSQELSDEETCETSYPVADIRINESFKKPLYDGADLTVFESYSLLLQYSLRHGLTKRAFSELLQLVGVHLPTKSMASLYKVKKFFLDLYGDIILEPRHCCSLCHSLLADARADCPQGCTGATTVEFLSIPISNQLKRRLEG